MQWCLRLGIHWPHKVFVTLEKKLTSLHYKRAPIYSRLKTLGLSCYIIQDHNACPKIVSETAWEVRSMFESVSDWFEKKKKIYLHFVAKEILRLSPWLFKIVVESIYKTLRCDSIMFVWNLDKRFQWHVFLMLEASKLTKRYCDAIRSHLSHFFWNNKSIKRKNILQFVVNLAFLLFILLFLSYCTVVWKLLSELSHGSNWSEILRAHI